eukprot:gene44958-52631_t
MVEWRLGRIAAALAAAPWPAWVLVIAAAVRRALARLLPPPAAAAARAAPSPFPAWLRWLLPPPPLPPPPPPPAVDGGEVDWLPPPALRLGDAEARAEEEEQARRATVGERERVGG